MKKSYLTTCFTTILVLIIGFTISAHAANECSTASFKVSLDLGSGPSIYQTVVADLNGDGHLDIASVSNPTNEVIILFGRGGRRALILLSDFQPPRGLCI